MNSESQQKIYCSQISIREGEPLTGTATRTQVNFLLEYNGTWGERAFEESNLPAVVKEYMVAQTKAMAESRILLLRREGGQVGRLHFFVASVTEGNEAIYEFHLDSYEDLLSLDMAAITASGPGYVEYQRKAPLFLVCTHGRRDACCARFGLPVYQALRSELGEAIWQCSHVGGHRFAANLLCFPMGLVYGRMTPESAERVVKAALRGEVDLAHYRGRMSYKPAAQAAEYDLRKRTGVTSVGAYHLFSAEETEPGRWRVRFLERSTHKTHQLILEAKRIDAQVYESCRLDKIALFTNYTLVEHIVQETGIGRI